MSADHHQTRLCLTSPPLALDQLEPLTQLLDRLSSKLDIACVNLPLGETGGHQSASAEQQQLKTLIEGLQQKDIAVLADLTSTQYTTNRKSFEKALENAHNLGCDGLHMNADRELFERARDVLDDHAIIGVDCSVSRHAAMQMGELGADYVGFSSVDPDTSSLDDDRDHDLDKGTLENSQELFEPETITELVDWWQQLFEVPCVALNVADRPQMEGLREINADFVAIGSSLWAALESDEELLNWLVKQYPNASAKA